ncbi:MAG: SusC/RagA family TonB-linked outer membrane protein [Bacteroidota bacterium]
MKTKFNGILTLLLALVVQFTFAQDRTISGSVSDETGPLPGVSILIDGTTRGTETDFDGNYNLMAKTGDVLRFSFVGMSTVTRTVGDSNLINVTMIPEDNTLDEVVLTALGLEVKKENDLSSSTAVEPDLITKSGESGLIQGLAGKTSGLKITKSSGDPGAGAYIQIRGQNTITGSSSPLIVIDGIPVSNTNVNIQSSGTAGVTEQSRLNDFNPEDIAKVTVLKGAAAAAVWGTGAANGVIIIQTKKGKVGKMSVDITSSTAFDRINVEFEKQGIYGEGSRGVWRENYSLSWGDKIADRSGEPDILDVGNRRFESYTTGNVIYPIDQKNDRTVYNDINRDQVFGTGMTFNNGVSISYAHEKSNTFMSFSNWTQDGIIKGKSNYKRNTLRLNHDVQLSDKFTAKFSTYYAYISSDRIQQGSNLSGLYLGYLRTSPDFNNTDYIGTYYDSNNVPTQNSHRAYRKSIGGTSKPVYNNPGWTINEQDNPNRVNRFTIAPELNWQFTSSIKLTARYGLDYYNDHRETYFPVYSAGEGNGEYYQDDITEKTENFNIFAQGIHDVNDAFSFDWILGTSFDSSQYARMSGTSIGFTNPDVDELRIFGNTTAENEIPDSYKSETRKHGVYAVANFNLFNQLLISASGRYERPSTLEKNVFYPSVSLGWKFSELLGDNDFINFGKLRASYGEVGIEPGAYTSSTTYGPGGIGSSWGDGLAAAAYGNPFTRSSTLGNPDLKEERVKEFEVGADFRFLKNKLNFGITYYDRVTEDAILYIDVAPTTGYTRTPTNAAEITNKGLEIDFGINIFRSENFSWDINGFYSHNKNLVTDLAGVVEVGLAGFTSASSSVVEGEPMAVLMGNGFLYDDNGDYVLDVNGFPQVDPIRRKIGDPNPEWIGGLGTSLKFGGFTLSALFETSQGNDHWAGTSGVLKYFGIDPETANESVAQTDLPTYNSSTIIPAGTTFRGNVANFGGNDVALTQNWYTQLGGGFGSQRESFVEDASWTRLRELSLGYTIHPDLISRTGLTHFEILFTGRNLFLWTDIEGFDPDINLTGPTKGRGLDYFTNPATQSFIVTLKFGF